MFLQSCRGVRMGSQHSKEGPDQSHPVAAGWWTEGFLQRQGWMSGQTNFFKVNCWPSSENIKVESGKYPHQIQQATDMLAARGILDGEESQAPWSSSLPPRHRPHHHQDSGGQVGQPGFPRDVQVSMVDWNTWEEHESIHRPGSALLPRARPAVLVRGPAAGVPPGVACHQTSELPTVHYGLTGG